MSVPEDSDDRNSVQDIQDILQKEVITVKDLETLFQIDNEEAKRIMAEIKKYGDRLGLKERIHRKDYLEYINRL